MRSERGVVKLLQFKVPLGGKVLESPVKNYFAPDDLRLVSPKIKSTEKLEFAAQVSYVVAFVSLVIVFRLSNIWPEVSALPFLAFGSNLKFFNCAHGFILAARRCLPVVTGKQL